MKYRGFYKVLVFALAMVMLMSTTSIVSFAAGWSGNASQITPAQTNDGFYLLASAEDLAWFANQINSDAGNATLKGRLTSDIYLNDIENEDFSKYWTPIGNYSADGKVFSGIFDGNDFTVYGMTISSSNRYQGLFGYLSGAKIMDLKIDIASVTGDSEVGAIAGYSNSSTVITSCIVNANVVGSSNVGGITGYLTNSSKIEKCAFSGSVNATENRVGGITGCAAFTCEISESYNEATVYSTGKFVGGICGTNSGSHIISCYNRGKVSGTLRVAGICGNNVGDISYSYNASNVESITNPPGLIGAVAAYYYSAVITECYYDSEIYTGIEDNAIALKTDEMMRHKFVSALNDAGGNYYYDYIFANNGYPILSWQVDLNLWDGTIAKPNKSSDGKYYYINNARELAWFAGLVNGTIDGVAQDTDASAMLMNSVVLNIGEITENSNVWTPIGSGINEYNGEFIGNGFTIKGMYIPSGDVVGLFGSVTSSGSINNVTVAESSINGTYAVGAIVGRNFGKVERTKVIYSTVNGETSVGGIVGENGGSVYDSSSVLSEISGITSVGGVAGDNLSDSVIQTCCSSSTVNAENNVGGIAGKNGANISFSFNSGDVNATDSYAGGIAGRIMGSIISNCYNTGVITATSKVGGIAGQLTEGGEIKLTYSVGDINGAFDANAILGGLTNGTVTNAYYDSNKVNVKDKNATGLTTLQMTGRASVDNMNGFEHQYWTPAEDSDYFVYYPQLVSFAMSGDFDLYDMSVESVSYLKDGLIIKVINYLDISYFATLPEAADKIGTSKGTFELLESVTMTKPTQIRGDVTIVPTNDSIILKRDKNMFESPFVVSDGGVLNFGTADDTYASLIVDGSNVTDSANQKFPEALIFVEDGGILNYNNAVTKNCRALNGAVVYNKGIANFYYGAITENTALQNGGVVYSISEVNVYATELYNNNSKISGGVIYNASGDTNINTSADIHNNTSDEGGAVYVKGGKANVLGGSIYRNSAPYGGAFYVGTLGEVVLYDGSIYENSAAVNGAAVYTEGNVSFYAGGNVDATNDIFLPNGKVVTMLAKSEFLTSIATLTPEKYTEGLKVIEGEYTAMNASLCAVTPQNDTDWHINSGGNLTTSEIKYVLTATFFKADAVPYTSIEEAMADIEESINNMPKPGDPEYDQVVGDPAAIITLIDDVVVSEPIRVLCDLTIESDGNPHTLSACEGFRGNMFEVTTGKTLSLGTRIDTYDTDVLFIDGTNLTGETMINVGSATVHIYSGTVIYGCNEINSAIKSKGLIEMYGGKVTENNVKRGAFDIIGGTFKFFGGTIFDNTNVAIYLDGTLNILDGVGVDKSNIVYIRPNRVINLVTPDPIYDEETGEEIDQGIVIPDLIAVIDYEKYLVDTMIIRTNDDILKYTGKFILKDDTFTLDERNVIRASNFAQKTTSTLIKTEDNIHGLSVNTYTAQSLAMQFENENIAVMTSKGRIKSDDEKVGTGDKLVLLDKKGVSYRELPILIYGDIDSDGDVNGNDAFMITAYIYGFFRKGQFEAVEIEAMDVDHNGVVDENDVKIVEDMGLLIGNINQTP